MTYSELKNRGWSEDQIAAVYNHAEVIDWNDYEFSDNWRYARRDNPAEVAEYATIRANGCCGYYDVEIPVYGQSTIMFGFNYGH